MKTFLPILGLFSLLTISVSFAQDLSDESFIVSGEETVENVFGNFSATVHESLSTLSDWDIISIEYFKIEVDDAVHSAERNIDSLVSSVTAKYSGPAQDHVSENVAAINSSLVETCENNQNYEATIAEYNQIYSNTIILCENIQFYQQIVFTIQPQVTDVLSQFNTIISNTQNASSLIQANKILWDGSDVIASSITALGNNDYADQQNTYTNCLDGALQQADQAKTFLVGKFSSCESQ